MENARVYAGGTRRMEGKGDLTFRGYEEEKGKNTVHLVSVEKGGTLYFPIPLSITSCRLGGGGGK